MTAESTQAASGPQAAARDSMHGHPRREGATIGAGTRINGELQADEDLLIEGAFTGTLVLRNHQLAIGGHGQVKGTAYANTVTVDGHIEGDLYAAERISIRKGAKVQGNILSPRVSLEDGAVLRGSVEMDPEAIQEAIQKKFGDTDKTSRPVESKSGTVPITQRAGTPAPEAGKSEPGRSEPGKADAGRDAKGEPGKPGGGKPEAVAASR